MYEEIISKQREHWSKLAREKSGSVQAVGSESMEHKRLRYIKILKLIESENDFTIHEIGPGVGDFFESLKQVLIGINYDYSASEITQEYCEIMRKRFPDVEVYYRDVLTETVKDTYDYVVLSGVFHQQGDVRHRDWLLYMKGLLGAAWEMASNGIAFNVITEDADYYKPGNYYANLAEMQSYITQKFSRFYHMDKTYPLFEATFCVYKPDYIKRFYSQAEFQKYLKGE